MTKTNPLFVDSTKLHGDAIGTHVELRNVMVYDDEDLVLLVTNHQGVAIRVPMKASEGRSFEARIHLNHQRAITYQFVIEKAGRTVLESTVYKGRAQYALIEEWQPIGVEGQAGLPVSAPPTPAAAVASEKGWPGEYAKSVKGLIEKWGL